MQDVFFKGFSDEGFGKEEGRNLPQPAAME